MYGYIYLTYNKINGKIYIGKKVSNKFLFNKYQGSGKLIRESLEKYGKENFDTYLIEKCNSNQELNKREIYWIDYFNSIDLQIGYNISKGGDGGNNINGKNRIWIAKHNKRKFIDKSELHTYLEDGWNTGTTDDYREKCRTSHLGKTHKSSMKGKIYVSKSDDIKLIDKSQLSSYISLGYTHKHNHQKGRPNMKNNTITKGRIWITDGNKNKMIYESDLINYPNFYKGITR